MTFNRNGAVPVRRLAKWPQHATLCFLLDELIKHYPPMLAAMWVGELFLDIDRIELLECVDGDRMRISLISSRQPTTT